MHDKAEISTEVRSPFQLDLHHLTATYINHSREATKRNWYCFWEVDQQTNRKVYPLLHFHHRTSDLSFLSVLSSTIAIHYHLQIASDCLTPLLLIPYHPNLWSTLVLSSGALLIPLSVSVFLSIHRCYDLTNFLTYALLYPCHSFMTHFLTDTSPFYFSWRGL